MKSVKAVAKANTTEIVMVVVKVKARFRRASVKAKIIVTRAKKAVVRTGEIIFAISLPQSSSVNLLTMLISAHLFPVRYSDQYSSRYSYRRAS